MHKPIQIKNISLSFPHKTCFDDFSATIFSGNRIAIIGRNGSGKTTLLKMLGGKTIPTTGDIVIPADVIIGYVPQIIEDYHDASGGERFNAALTAALSIAPNVLLLDEPTNHLDISNRKSLLRMLRAYQNTLLVVTHDVELLRTCIDTIWHIDNGHIHVFAGNYDNYIREISNKHSSIEQELAQLKKQKQEAHQALMQEQKRAAKSRDKGTKSIVQRKWPTIVSKAKALRAEETSGRKKTAIEQQKQQLLERLDELRLPEEIVPKFSLTAADLGDKTILAINHGQIGYDSVLVADINLALGSHERIAIMGKNGCGKTTLFKALLGDPQVVKSGEWHMPNAQDIGYLDQHYGTLDPEKTVFDTVYNLVPTWSQAEIRKHLNDFLFRKNEEVNALVKTLSGGEKVRLTLAQIAAKTPRLLLLDEITNNIDLETRAHIIQILKAYPGAIIVISHDEDFLQAIGISENYWIDGKSFARKALIE